MADFLTHLTAAKLPATFLRDRRVQALLIFGTFLPDLFDKGVDLILRAPANFSVPSHTLPGLILFSYLACLFVEERLRPAAFAALYAGGVVHVVVDLFKDNQGAGVAMILYPFSTRGVEFGLIDPEDVILLLPVNVAILSLLWLAERRFDRVRE